MKFKTEHLSVEFTIDFTGLTLPFLTYSMFFFFPSSILQYQIRVVLEELQLSCKFCFPNFLLETRRENGAVVYLLFRHTSLVSIVSRIGKEEVPGCSPIASIFWKLLQETCPEVGAFTAITSIFRCQV